MSQGFVASVPGGPEWVFHRDGQEVTTKPHLTLTLADGSTAYWSAVEGRCRGELPDWVQVQQYHAEREGAGTWVLTDEFIRSNLIEFTNRTDAYYFLTHARDWDSALVERDLLMAVHPRPRTLAQLQRELEQPPSHVKAAALRLWRRRLVALPMANQPMSDQWLVRGEHHGLG